MGDGTANAFAALSVAGLYQINLQLPDSLDANPFIKVRIGDQVSADGIKLAVQP